MNFLEEFTSKFFKSSTEIDVVEEEAERDSILEKKPDIEGIVYMFLPLSKYFAIII